MLANQGDELIGCDQKCNCIDKSKQSQNDKSRQPIGIPSCEESLENASLLLILEFCLPAGN